MLSLRLLEWFRATIRYTDCPMPSSIILLFLCNQVNWLLGFLFWRQGFEGAFEALPPKENS
jgi:ABC-type polysaccharide/polyol phosphate export permease